jgi:hypothetical protein
MSTETQSELQQLKDEITAIKAELFTLQRNQSSRRGLDGARGPAGKDAVGIPGAPGRDAVIKIVQADGKISVVDTNGKVHAEIIAVKGDQGIPGQGGPAGKDSTVPGPQGKPGVSPSIESIVDAVLTEFSARVKK